MIEPQVDLDAMFQFLLIGVIIGGVVLWVIRLMFDFSAKTLGRLVMIGMLVMLLFATKISGDGSGTGFITIMLVVFVVFTVVTGVLGWIMSKLTGGRINIGSILLFLIGFIGTKKALEWEKRKVAKHDAEMSQYDER